MAEYVVPNTTVWLIRNCPCEPDYKNTLYFGSKDAQLATFANWIKYRLDAHSYQRYGAGRIQVEKAVEDLYDCNYLLFQNTNFKDSSGNAKWFYAFITDVEYVNNNTSTITYEIDVLQTWLKDYEVQDVMVLREHPLTDEVGDNIVPEGLQTGEMVIDNLTDVEINGTPLSELWMMAWYADGNNANVISGIPTMLSAVAEPFTDEGLTTFNSIISNALSTDANAIISFGLVPALFAQIGQAIVGPTEKPKSYMFSVPKNYGNSFVSFVAGKTKSYKPQCKKLYTSPYWSLWVSNNNGATKSYAYELFGTAAQTVSLQLIGDYTASPSVILAPVGYKFSGTDSNFSESITLSGFPQCGTATDTFKAWLAQQGGATAVQFIGGALMAVLGAVSQNYSGAIAGGAQVAGAIANTVTASNLPDSGNPGGNNNVLAAFHKMTFTYGCKHLTAESAQRIDDYFKRYGYAVHQVKKPNIGTRPYYNYVQTQNCAISGSIPASAEKRICEIFDAGVTWWVSVGKFGDYSVDNSPTATQSAESEVSNG